MARSLMHLPTKTATVNPESGRPFVRQQHVNLNPDEPAPESRGPESIDPATKLYLLKNRQEQKPEGERHIDNGGADTPLGEALKPKTRELDRGETIIDRNLPEEMFTRNNFRKVGRDTMNGVYTFQSDEGYQFYQKPREEELSGFNNKMQEKIEKTRKLAEVLGDPTLVQELWGNAKLRNTIDGNLGGREIAAYELTKLLGVEGLIPPTREYGHQVGFGDKGYNTGPAQLSAQDFGERMLGHDEVVSPGKLPGVNDAGNIETARLGLRKMFDKAKNGTDFVLFDFIAGQTDRIAGNFFVGKSKHGDYQMISTDNGLSFPDHRGDIIHPDSQNNFELWHDYFNSSGRDRPIDQKFMEGILDFNSKNFHEMAGGHGISEGARNGVVDRVKMIQDVIKEKYVTAMENHPPEKYNSVEERNAAIRKDILVTGNDIANMFKNTVMNPIDKFGKVRYTPTVLQDTGWVRPDHWEKQLNWIIEKDNKR